MKCIVTNVKAYDALIFDDVEKKYSISIRDDIKEFFEKNSGGYPVKDIIVADEDEYEVRVFLSADKTDKNYCVEKPMDFFLEKTKGKIIPLGIDSGDNYYCVNNETGKVYFWSAGENQYYCISESLNEFSELF